jgi:hypothetical protein
LKKRKNPVTNDENYTPELDIITQPSKRPQRATVGKTTEEMK